MFSQPLLTADEIARVLSVSRKTIYKLTENGTLPCIRIGRAVRFDPADVEAFLQQAKQNGEG